MATLLAIESSCDETAAAVVVDQRVCSSVVASQIPIHARFGGVVPELASRNHLTAIRPVIEQALADAETPLEGLDAIAVTAGPGLAGCLLVGLQTAKALAWTRGLPLVAVDHIEAHVHAVFLTDDGGAGAQVPPYPYVALAVSGGHTSLMLVRAPGTVEPLGRTLDDAAGEAFDKVAKLVGLPYPGGAEIDRLAQRGDPAAVDLPRPMMGRGLDFSFSGLKTAARYAWERDRPALQDFAASFQEAVADVLVSKALSACRETGVRRVVAAGGVACNSRLRSLLLERGSARNVEVYLAPPRYCTDNAAMIGGLGAALLDAGGGLRGDALLTHDIYTRRST